MGQGAFSPRPPNVYASPRLLHLALLHRLSVHWQQHRPRSQAPVKIGPVDNEDQTGPSSIQVTLAMLTLGDVSMIDDVISKQTLRAVEMAKVLCDQKFS